MTTFTIELDGPDHPDGTADSCKGSCVEAELQITHFRPGTPATYHDPGDGPEVSLAPFVTILVNGEPVGEIPYDVLVLEYASANAPNAHALSLGIPRMTRTRAEEKIEDLAIEAAADRYSDDFDDYGEDEYEDRMERMERMECAGQGGWS